MFSLCWRSAFLSFSKWTGFQHHRNYEKLVKTLVTMVRCGQSEFCLVSFIEYTKISSISKYCLYKKYFKEKPYELHSLKRITVTKWIVIFKSFFSMLSLNSCLRRFWVVFPTPETIFSKWFASYLNDIQFLIYLFHP